MLYVYVGNKQVPVTRAQKMAAVLRIEMDDRRGYSTPRSIKLIASARRAPSEPKPS